MDLTGVPVITLPSVGEQTIWLPVSDTAPDGTVINVSGGSVDVSFTEGGDPTVWSTAAWETDPIVINGDTYYLARVTIGPSSLVIPKGYWFLWLRLDFSSPSSVIRHSSLYLY